MNTKNDDLVDFDIMQCNLKHANFANLNLTFYIIISLLLSLRHSLSVRYHTSHGFKRKHVKHNLT